MWYRSIVLGLAFNMCACVCVCVWGLPRGSSCNAGTAGDADSIPGSGRSPGGGNGSPLQYSCLENPMDRGAWPTTVYRVTKSWTQLYHWAQMHMCVLNHSSLCDHMNCSPPDSAVHGILQERILEWEEGHAVLQGIFPIQGSNLCFLRLLHWQAGSLPLTPPGKPEHTHTYKLTYVTHFLLYIYLVIYMYISYMLYFLFQIF